MGKGAISVGAVAVLVLAAGCKAAAIDTDGGRPSAAGGGGDGKPGASAPATPAPDPTPGRTKPSQPREPSQAPDPSKPREPQAPQEPQAPPKTLLARGAHGGQVRELQARLRQVAWFHENPTGTYGPATTAAVSGFQGKRGLPRTGAVDTATWQRLLAMTREPTRFERYAGGGIPPAKPDPRCLTGRVLCIAKSSRTLTWMVNGKARSTMDVRFGAQYTPTREGTFSVYWKSRHHVSTLFHTAMPYAMFFSGGQAVHYSSDFAATGYGGASHGCVNVRDEKKIAKLFGEVRKGDKVVVYK
ncbi:L,D-transpeptidase family protein [Streptomyces formicae]|uniref:ErfK/YbiS/YcfS/YnhG family protein n=1 Tax=Streptomyces formicae TaxID=1616117 RepID=A0A291QEZ3_9ACTN|nr:L,D-transpeptidase family protein [Streptomyces formicae]ATL30005.1 ErfK/YbiS/YcfS/YnhG family protein [Streptomyces formicae]